MSKPVSGSHHRLSILLVASEAVPFAKTGGLADVAGVLPRQLARLGHDVRLVIPHYAMVDAGGPRFKEWGRLEVPTSDGAVEATVQQAFLDDETLRRHRRAQVFTVRYDPYFKRPGLYQEGGEDYADNLERFALFSRAVIQLLLQFRATGGWVPSIVHAHDWQTALCLAYLKILYADYSSRHRIATIFTIHNLGYQGIFPGSSFPKTGLPPSLFTPQGLEFHGSCNLLKAGLIYADVLTTVSETYSREIQTPEFGFGLEGVLSERRDRLVGIVNGIDPTVWNPQTDPFLATQYTAADLGGKGQCKKALQRDLDVPVKDVPVLGVISRLSWQKGVDLIADMLPELMPLDVEVVILGTGDTALETRLRRLRQRYPDHIGLRLAFDEGLAHRIEGGADMFLMPSRYEPCGLSQLYSLRYGTIPIARRTGGLADTIVPYAPLALQDKRATGFTFGGSTAEDLLTAVLLALQIYQHHPTAWQQMMRTGMNEDVSWERSARAYDRLYRRVATPVS